MREQFGQLVAAFARLVIQPVGSGFGPASCCLDAQYMTENAPSLTVYSSREAMAEMLAKEIAASLAAAISEKGEAAIALSGGSTPAGLYEALSAHDLDWRRVTAALVDERWVPPGAAGSNETFAKDTLQRGKAAGVKLIGMWSNAPSPADGLGAAQKRYGAIEEFDVVILGMGNDGHTASWFPECDGLARALGDEDRLAAITARRSEVTGDHLQRMTLTLGAIKSASFIYLLLSGEEKRKTIETASQEGPVAQMPVRAILRARPDLKVCWAA